MGAAASAIAFPRHRPTSPGMTSSDQRPPDRPRSEPEIIPPEHTDRRQDGRSHVWMWVADREGMRQANVTLPGPFTIFLALALVALVVGGLFLVVLGAVLIWIPVFVLAVGALLIAAAARQYWWRFRRWLSQH
jgi:hypothetical protein